MASQTAHPIDDIVLENDQVVNQRWRVREKLGEGGFGAVYKVVNVKDSKHVCAMKVETLKEPDSMVKMEAVVLKAFARAKVPSVHVCEMFECNETPTFRYIVMQLVGRNLSDLRRACPEARFKLSTVTRLGVQCLESIEALHKVGFLHRDIKSGNFAVGHAEKDRRLVFMLDYGLCRQYIAPDGQLRRQRPMAAFRGTVRYASINTHRRKELGRHDDIVSMMYMMTEWGKGGLPWQKVEDKDEVGKMKEEMPAEELMKEMEPEFVGMFKKALSLKYENTPNYAWFQLQFKMIMNRRGVRKEQPFEWEPEAVEFGVVQKNSKRTPEKKKRKKRVKKERVDDGERT